MSTGRFVEYLAKVSELQDEMSAVRSTLVALALEGSLTDRADEPPVDGLPGMRQLLAPRPRYRWEPQPPDQDASGRPGWITCRLGETGLYVNGLAFKPSDWGQSGRPIIRIQNLSGVSAEHHFTDREVAPDNLVHDGDLLVSWSATLDTFVWRGPEAVLNQHIFKVIPNLSAVRPRFLYWLLKHEVKQLADSQHAHGLAMMHINRGPFLGHTIALPPLAEQERIVAKIDDLMRLCDELEAAQGQRAEITDRLRAASLARLTAPSETPGKIDQKDVAFFLSHSDRMVTKPEHIGDLRQVILDLAACGALANRHGAKADLLPAEGRPFGLPQGWTWVQVRDLLESDRDISYGVIKLGPEPRSGGVPTLRCSDVKPRRLVLEGVRTVDEAIEAQYARTRLRGGEVVINVRGTLGGVALVPDALRGYNVAREVAVVPIAKGISGEFIVNVMAASFFWDSIEESLRGIAYVGLNLRTLRELWLPLPPIAEQHAIVAKVDELMTVCDHSEHALQAAEEGRAKLLEAVLHQALNGRNVRAELAAVKA